METIILRVVPYKEKDSIVTALSKNGIITFNARGFLKNNSPFSVLSMPLLIADVELEESKKTHRLILKGITSFYTPFKREMSLLLNSAVTFLNEITIRLLNEEEMTLIYDVLKNCLLNLNENISFSVLLYYLLKVLSVAGYEFNVNGCVRCNEKKDITAFIFKEGGFICNNCIKPDEKSDLSLIEMKIIHDFYIYKSIEDMLSMGEYDETLIISVLNKTISFIENEQDTKIKSYSLLKASI